MTVGVYAGDLKTTTPAEIPCLISILCGDAEVADENIQEFRDIAQQAAVEAQQAAEEAKKAATVVVHPSIDVEAIEGGHKLTIHDAYGDESFNVMNGKNGGEDGEDGEDGATFTPSVSSTGMLSWTNNKGLTNPATVNIKGGKGDNGDDGATFTPSVSSNGVLSWTNDKGLSNPASVNIKGSDGNGISKIEKLYSVGLVDTYRITYTNNSTFDFTVKNGQDGSGSGSVQPSENGATFIPSVSADGIISWVNDKGLTNPTPVNIKGSDGVGISAAEINGNGELVITYTNGNPVTLGKVVGESSGGSGGGLTGEQLVNFNEMWNWYSEQIYQPMTLTITPTGKTYELGSKNTFTLEWTFSQDVSSVTINDEAQTASSKGSKQITIEYKPQTPANGEFKYKVVGTRKDGKKESKDATCTINFHNRFYWGYALDSRSSLNDDIEEAFVKNLSKTGSKGFGSSRSISFSIKCPKDNYIWYAYPKRFGLGNMSMAPSGSSMYLPGGFEDPKSVSITNDSNYTEEYYVYRSINPELNQTVKVT